MFNLIEAALDKFLLPNPHFQDYINYRYNTKEYELINKKFLDNAFCRYNGTYYAICDQLHSIDEVLDYDHSDIISGDVVLDIGANIGAFTMLAAKKAKHVFAVEPIYTDILQKNIEKNGLKNVTIINTGIGSGTHTIQYGNESKEVSLTTFTDIIKKCGQIDFLKCDCEGCEWYIKPTDLSGIRRIEIEVHRFHGMPPVTAFKVMLDKAGFSYEMDVIRKNAVIIHARAKECL